ncbi:MAG TPA: hypothetical protein ENK50_02100 [Sedimenticola sp.]|nr:hypothetical protein [Sedimenticola sp.]
MEINLLIDNDDGLADTVFTLDGVPIYRFGDSRHYSVVLDQGTYRFGYTRAFGPRCTTEVDIESGGHYVFDLKPGCVIELESE